MTEFLEISPAEDLSALAALAKEIWTEYYTPLLGAAQVDYMLTNIQSEAPMRRQMEQASYRYFFLRHGTETVGYLGVQTQDNALFLSKLYVKKSARGKGTARDVMAFLEGWARGARLQKIKLTVNRGNTDSIKTYERLHFSNVGIVDSPIGEGYVMEDYVFEKPFAHA